MAVSNGDESDASAGFWQVYVVTVAEPAMQVGVGGEFFSLEREGVFISLGSERGVFSVSWSGMVVFAVLPGSESDKSLIEIMARDDGI